MPFRFKTSDGSVELGFRRIACTQLDELLSLVRAGNVPPERIIHQARRTCKAMRGLFRLVRSAFPAFETENATFRDLSRSLSSLRDQKVLRDTLDHLAGKRLRGSSGLARLQQALSSASESPSAKAVALDSIVGPLLAARVRADSWPVTANDWPAIEPGLRHVYRDARRAMRKWVETGDDPQSHEWRKQVKYHWQHMRLLRQVSPSHVGQRVKPLARLGDCLGERHDLDLLLHHFSQIDVEHPLIAALEDKALRRRTRLDGEAQNIGAQLFEQSPADFASTCEIRNFSPRRAR